MMLRALSPAVPDEERVLSKRIIAAAAVSTSPPVSFMTAFNWPAWAADML